MQLTQAGIENYIYHAIGHCDDPNCISYSNLREIRRQALRSRLSGRYGFVSERMTGRLVDSLRQLQPDIVHLHNLHSHNCKLDVLLKYLTASKIKVVWTMHDCWAFTGGCTHYALAGCDRWQTGCGACPQRSKYSVIFDHSRELWEAKQLLTEKLDLTLVAPSEWMAQQLRASCLKDHPIHVIQNGIDLQVFRPSSGSFLENCGLEGKHVILGVASDWGPRKGLDVFAELAAKLDESYRIVLVGISETLARKLPRQILSLRRTADRKELAEIYSAADVFLNPTREDTFPTVNLEALACGTPVLTFDTGGSPEILDSSCGVFVSSKEASALPETLRWICTSHPFSREQCRTRALQFDKNLCFRRYLELYQSILFQ